MFEAGASQRADGRAVHRRHRAAAHRGVAATPTSSTGSSGRRWPARRSASLAVTEPGGGSDVAGIRTTARPRRRPLRRQRRQDVHHLRRARRLRHHRGPHRRARATRGISLLVVEKGTPGFTVDRALAKMGWHCSDTAELVVRRRAGAGRRTWSARRTPASRRSPSSSWSSGSRWPCTATASPPAALALTAAYCRERETFGRPLVANQVVRHRLVEMHRRVEVARTYTRAVAAPARRRRERRSPRRCLAKQTAVEARDVRLRPGRAAARRHRLPARDRGGAALPRRPDPAASEEERPRCSTT